MSPLLQVQSISKRFPGVPALENVSLNLARGEVLAVVGENGAGKSTLMKILAGVQQPDSGEILLDGRAVRIASVRAAQQHGIALIHQELNLADNLTVAANIFLGREPRRGWFIRTHETETGSTSVLQQVGLDISPRMLVSRLSLGRQQLVEIAKALSAQARVLIMDEPTSSLSQHETETLFRVIRDLRARDVSIIYI
jgi:ribose transport system ATP-binding protein